jgi:DNA-binding XRE family transcriptional regulator
MKTTRIEKGMTQQELAEKTKLSLSTIVKAERNNTCTLESAYRIAKGLDKTIEDIFFK